MTWTAAAAVLAQCGDMPRRMLETHIPDGRGRCESCTEAECAPIRWPCPIRSLALDAFVLQRRIPQGALVIRGIGDSML